MISTSDFIVLGRIGFVIPRGCRFFPKQVVLNKYNDAIEIDELGAYHPFPIGIATKQDASVPIDRASSVLCLLAGEAISGGKEFSEFDALAFLILDRSNNRASFYRDSILWAVLPATDSIRNRIYTLIK